MPPKYVFASALISLGGFANGYDTGSIGGMLSMAQFKKSIGALSPSLVGFTVSLIMLTGAIPSVFAGHLADSFGRLRVIVVGAALFGIGSLLEGTANSLAQFLIGRALAGFGEGVYLANLSVYTCEIAPVRHRGTLAGLPSFMATAGICAGYFTCYGSGNLQSSLAWRIPSAVQCVIAAGLILSCLILPESPRWLILQGQRTKALQSLERLDFPMTEAGRDFLIATEQRPSLSPWQGFLLLFKRGYRQRTILALFVLGMAQLSGIDGVLYYAPSLFSQAGLSSDTASFLASGVSGILMVAVSIPAFLLVDKWGRRTSAISGGLVLSGCMLLMGCLYAADAVHSYEVARWVVITAVFVFGLTYCATWGMFGKVYASEIQPANTRAAANSIATGLAFFTNWLVAILTPILLDKSAFGAYFLFGGLAFFTVLVLAVYMPETRGRSLENIQVAFQQPKVLSLAHWLQSCSVSRQTRQVPLQTSNASLELEDIDTEGRSTVVSDIIATGRSRVAVTIH